MNEKLNRPDGEKRTARDRRRALNDPNPPAWVVCVRWTDGAGGWRRAVDALRQGGAGRGRTAQTRRQATHHPPPPGYMACCTRELGGGPWTLAYTRVVVCTTKVLRTAARRYVRPTALQRTVGWPLAPPLARRGPLGQIHQIQALDTSAQTTR